jgi:hypothetical protein
MLTTTKSNPYAIAVDDRLVVRVFILMAHVDEVTAMKMSELNAD